MAQNFVSKGHAINAAASDPAEPKSGDPCVVGTIAGVAETDEGAGGNKAGESTIATKGIFAIPVKGTNGAIPIAVGLGERLYYTAADGVCKDTTGVLYGKALGTVELGDPDPITTTIPVLLVQG